MDRRVLWGGVGLVALAGILAFVFTYSDYIGARVAPGIRFRILGPSTLSIGQMATITWDASTAGVKRYPLEKIEYCTGKAPALSCRVLAAVIPNNGKATVEIPTGISAGKGYIKLTARTQDKKLVGNLVSLFPVTVRQPTFPAPAVEEFRDDGEEPPDDAEDRPSGDGDEQAPVVEPSVPEESETPAPQDASAEFVEPLDGDVVAVGVDVDARVELTRVSGTSLGCQVWELNGRSMVVDDWVGGQSPDLSSDPCN